MIPKIAISQCTLRLIPKVWRKLSSSNAPKTLAISRAKKSLSNIIKAKISSVINAIKKDFPPQYADELDELKMSLSTSLNEQYILPMTSKEIWIDEEKKELFILLQLNGLELIEMKGTLLYELATQVDAYPLIKRHLQENQHLMNKLNSAVNRHFR